VGTDAAAKNQILGFGNTDVLDRQVFPIVLALVGLSAAVRPVLADQSEQELRAHLATLEKQVENASFDVLRRERLTMEMASTLDRAAQASQDGETRRARWTEAAQVLDRFNERNPEHTQARQFQYQAAVYLWAVARSWADQARLSPADPGLRDHAIETFETTIARLKTVSDAVRGATDLFAQHIRYRLGQALADRAELDPSGTVVRRTREEEAVRLLEPAFSDPSLSGFAHLLRADLLGRLGQLEKAMAELDAAAVIKPPLPTVDLLSARVTLMIGQKRFDEAIKAIDQAAGVEAAARDGLAVQVRLAERARLPKGEERSAVETDLFQRVARLRASGKPEARRALIALASELTEPDENQAPDAWEAVAEGALILGEIGRASDLEGRAADRLAALGQTGPASALRLRSGALLFQAEKYREADAILSRVADDPKAGSDRPRAGLLRTLARGRGLALRLPWATRAAYVAALEAQIRDFPDDPSANEARWLLGRLRLASGDRAGAEKLWSAIPAEGAHWLDTRLEIAALNQNDLDTQRINNDRERVVQRYDHARNFLTASLEQTTQAADQSALNLARARLDLTPGAGRPEDARLLCERIQKSASLASQRDRARRLHILALAELSRFVEAEQAAQGEAQQSQPPDLLEITRLIDRAAAESESDLRLRRFGLILEILLDRVLEHPDALTPDQLAEARVRQTRALIFRGDEPAARQSLSHWPSLPRELDDRWLKDLADTYTRLNVSRFAVDVQRLRAGRAPTGSLPWFEARYGLALAYARSGRANEARKLIDATSILHPELGGGELREKFIRLRQRLGSDE
jgi:hypothetical protein